MDCTHNHPGRWRPHRRGLLATSALLVTVLAASLAWLTAVARADGDPASDVLVTQPLFLAQDAGVTPAQQTQMTGVLESAAHAGFPIRVALIASSSDLGSVTELWRQPQSYAKFLGQELALVYRGPLLVVMPNGFGVYGSEPGLASALAGIGIAPGGQGLGAATLTAIQRLADAAGHPVALPAATPPAAGRDSSSPVVSIVFAVGAILIAIAWIASLRARPPGRRSGLEA